MELINALLRHMVVNGNQRTSSSSSSATNLMELMVGTLVRSSGNACQVSGPSQANSSTHRWSIGTGMSQAVLVIAILLPSPLTSARLSTENDEK